MNLVDVAKVILVVPCPMKGGRIVQKSCWNGCDLVLSSTEDDLLRELQTQCPLDLNATGAWTRVLLLVLELWIIVGAMRAVSLCPCRNVCQQ